jgi:hypothetical protein
MAKPLFPITLSAEETAAIKEYVERNPIHFTGATKQSGSLLPPQLSSAVTHSGSVWRVGESVKEKVARLVNGDPNLGMFPCLAQYAQLHIDRYYERRIIQFSRTITYFELSPDGRLLACARALRRLKNWSCDGRRICDCA